METGPSDLSLFPSLPSSLSCSPVPLLSPCPLAFQLCYCSICVKTGGSGGFGINLGGDRGSLKVEGEENITRYHARLSPLGSAEPMFSQAERAFCKLCGSHLWQYNEHWPELIHPYASAIDTELPPPPCKTHIMLDSKPSWVVPTVGPNDLQFPEYPKESLAEWHKKHAPQG